MPVTIILCILVGILIGAGIICIILVPKIKRTQELDKETEISNRAAQTELAATNEKIEFLKAAYDAKYNEYVRLKENIEEEASSAKTKALEHYQEMVEMYDQQFQIDKHNRQMEFEQAEQEYRTEYESVLKDAVHAFQEEINDILQQKAQCINDLNDLSAKLEEATATVNAAVEANKRAAEMESKEDFYKLQLSTEDIEEIVELRKCAKHLRNPEPLNKVIWKVYYEKAYTDLIGRVLGGTVHCGIYKITNFTNGMCYIGQAVNVADRWKQHIRRGIGADTPTRNKLYPAMLEIGVENFTFELIEDCDRSQLNQREDFWQDFFRAKEFGYSIK